MDSKKSLNKIITAWFEMKNKEISKEDFMETVENVVIEATLDQAYTEYQSNK